MEPAIHAKKMNYKKGIFRLSFLLTFIIALLTGYDSFSPSLYLLKDKGEYATLKEKILQEATSSPCKSGDITYFVETDTNKFMDFFILSPSGKDGSFKVITEKCPGMKEFAVILGQEKLKKIELKGGDLTPEYVQEVLDAHWRELITRGILEKCKAIALSVMWLWIVLAVLLGSVLSAKWVYKGFRS